MNETEETKIPWRRDRKGKSVERSKTGSCFICKKVLYDNLSLQKIIFCGLCTQSLAAKPEKGVEIRNKIRETSD